MNRKEQKIFFIITDLSYIMYCALSSLNEQYSQKEIAESLKFELQKSIRALDKILVDNRKK